MQKMENLCGHPWRLAGSSSPKPSFTKFFQAQCLLRKITVVSGVSQETVLALLFVLFLLLIDDYSDNVGQITGFSMTESSTEE